MNPAVYLLRPLPLLFSVSELVAGSSIHGTGLRGEMKRPVILEEIRRQNAAEFGDGTDRPE